jgi:transposase-like protein
VLEPQVNILRAGKHAVQECEAWRKRPLDSCYLYIHLDGVYFSVGYDDSFVKEPVLAALGVKLSGEKELLGYGP